VLLLLSWFGSSHFVALRLMTVVINNKKINNKVKYKTTDTNGKIVLIAQN
jgi:hypothetical protein